MGYDSCVTDTPECATLGCNRRPVRGGQNRRFCSSSCYNWNRANPGIPRPAWGRECAALGCSQEVGSLHANARYCSGACAQWAKTHPGTPIPERIPNCLACDEPLAGIARTARYCDSTCAQWSRRHPGVKRSRTSPKFERVCLCCGEVFMASKGNAKWCSQRCSNWRRKNAGAPPPAAPSKGDERRRAPIVGECLGCGEDFTTSTRWQKYCTDRCRHRANRSASRDQYRKRNHRRRALIRGGKVTDSATFAASWKRLLRRMDNSCAYCGSGTEPLTVDHVVPLSRGGHDSIGNTLPACLSCNSSKRAMTIMEWRLSGRSPMA